MFILTPKKKVCMTNKALLTVMLNYFILTFS